MATRTKTTGKGKVASRYVIDGDNGVVIHEVASGSRIDRDARSLAGFWQAMERFGYTDTGLLPVDGSGILRIQRAAGHEQFSYQVGPGIYSIYWGARERDPNAKMFRLAQPYRVVIADFHNGALVGARHFYSPVPVTWLDAPLYHVNLPNTNCKGYRSGVGVGWACLYHRGDVDAMSKMTEAERLRYVIERMSGTEAYNDGNMHETDGPRFYAEQGKEEFLVDPKAWEAKSATDGYEWILDENLLCPILVTSAQEQTKHVVGGVPLTFGMATEGTYKAYYQDEHPVKPFNIVRTGEPGDVTKIFLGAIRSILPGLAAEQVPAVAGGAGSAMFLSMGAAAQAPVVAPPFDIDNVVVPEVRITTEQFTVDNLNKLFKDFDLSEGYKTYLKEGEAAGTTKYEPAAQQLLAEVITKLNTLAS